MTHAGRGWGRVAVYAWGGVALFALLELVTRYWAMYLDPGAYLQWASRYQLRGFYAERGMLRQEPVRYLGYFPQPNYDGNGYRHNSYGFRGQEFSFVKPAGEFRIVCMGGSTTYDSAIHDSDKTWPAQLEGELQDRGYNVTVINAGNEAYTSYESLINYALRISYLDPDLLLDYDALNDLLARIVWPPEAYRSDNSGFRAPAGSQYDLPSLLDFSYFLQFALTRIGILDTSLDLFRTYDIVAPTWRALDEDLLNNEAAMKDVLAKNPPTFFERNMEHLTAMAKLDRVRVLFITFVHTNDWDESTLLGLLASGKNTQSGFAEMSAAMKAVAARTESPLFDLAAVYPPGNQYFADGIHFNEQGAQLQAKLIADYLCDSGLLPTTR